MSYVVVARKYRPKDFGSVVGQDAVTTTLKNAITLGRVAHAYLFTGPRGVGKTSLARIFSKALNCKNGPTVDPCGKCPSCVEIDEGRSLDVIEIDGASNRGIEDVRAIRENIKFSPAYGKFKIYIIDEVHQITQDGFNALLKTLEEPPAHAKFIFATTSAQKIPLTVLSRCQRFDFKRIPTKTIVATLADISKREKFKVREDALHEIAKAADGCLRDAESILDQIASFSKGEVTFKDVTEALGLACQEEFFGLFDAVAARDPEALLGLIDTVMGRGIEPVHFVEKCLEHVRNLMIVRLSPNLVSLIEASDEACRRIQTQAERFSKDDLFYIFAVLTHAAQNARRFQSKRVPIEMAFLKCALREPMVSLASGPAPRPAPASPAAPSAPAGVKKNPEMTPEVPASDGSGEEDDAADGAELAAVWESFIKRVRAEKISAATFLQEGAPIGIFEDAVVIGFPPELSFHAEALASETNTGLLERHLSELLNRKTRVEFRLKKRDGAPPADARPESNPLVHSAINIFGGRVIRN